MAPHCGTQASIFDLERKERLVGKGAINEAADDGRRSSEAARDCVAKDEESGNCEDRYTEVRKHPA